MSTIQECIPNFFPSVDPENLTDISAYHYFADWITLWKDISTNIYYDFDSRHCIVYKTRIPLNIYAHLAPLEIEEIRKNNDTSYLYSIINYYPEVDWNNIKYVYKKYDFISTSTFYRDITTDVYYASINRVWSIVEDITTFCLTYDDYLLDYQTRYQM